MSELMWIRSHVERLLQEEWGTCNPAMDPDGDYPFRDGTAACWVSVMDSEPAMVRVFAHAALRLRPSVKLLRELNEIQCRALTAKVWFEDGVVLVSQTISPLGLTRPVLAQAINAVGGVADDIGLLLAGMFNGVTPFPAETPESEDAV